MVESNEQAVIELERLARTLARRGGMVSGYLTLSIGAGNPDYFFEAAYKKDGYDSTGWSNSDPAITGNGPTLVAAVNSLLAAVDRGDSPGGRDG